MSREGHSELNEIWDEARHAVEAGDYEILVAAASDDIKLKLPMTVTAK